jgi:hypothetical protein
MKVNDPSPALMSAFENGYVLASWLYNSGTADSPWTDHDYDGCVGFLTHWKRLWSSPFRARFQSGDLKTEGHAVVLSDAEKERALLWSASGKHFSP